MGIATIEDDDTKFYVVNDAAPDKTFEYGSSGISGEAYSLNSSNTAPRGAASTIAGDKVWIVDANKNVYVYNTSGGLLGSWSLGSLSSAANVQGIATNGTDVWVVDAYADKVYKYTGAASRTSGSQNASSSFNLNSGNKSPTDIVTDGTYLWVVNDVSTTDKVFRYRLSKPTSGVVSWTVTTSGATSPTGITIDPSNASQDIWIVDNSSDKVYQYTNGRTAHFRQPSRRGELRPGRGKHEPAGHCRPAAGGCPTTASNRRWSRCRYEPRKRRTLYCMPSPGRLETTIPCSAQGTDKSKPAPGLRQEVDSCRSTANRDVKRIDRRLLQLLSIGATRPV